MNIASPKHSNLEAVRRYQVKYPERVKEAQRRFNLKHREELREKRREYYQNNPEKAKESARKWRAANPEKVKAMKRSNHLNTYHRKAYGISRAEFEQMLVAQAGLCKICESEIGRPHVDHNHFTGKIRGILCAGCNQGLGRFRDSPDFLRKAATYLEENN